MIWKYQSLHQTTRRPEDAIHELKSSEEDIKQMHDAIGHMTHSKLDMVLFCNAYEYEEIAYENNKLSKANQQNMEIKYGLLRHQI